MVSRIVTLSRICNQQSQQQSALHIGPRLVPYHTTICAASIVAVRQIHLVAAIWGQRGLTSCGVVACAGGQGARRNGVFCVLGSGSMLAGIPNQGQAIVTVEAGVATQPDLRTLAFRSARPISSRRAVLAGALVSVEQQHVVSR